MFDEATAFNKRLATCEKRIRDLKKATDNVVQTAEKVLSGAMPGVWDKDAAGNAIAVPGSNMGLLPAGQLRRSNSLELKTHVLDPIAQWQAEYHRMKDRMAELDRASLDLDAKRRAYYARTSKHIKENVLKQDAAHLPTPQEEQDPELQNARVRYEQTEVAVHAELVQLANRARAVQGYLSKSMQLEAEALMQASQVTQPSESALAVYSGPPVTNGAAPGLFPQQPPVAHLQT